MLIHPVLRRVCFWRNPHLGTMIGRFVEHQEVSAGCRACVRLTGSSRSSMKLILVREVSAAFLLLGTSSIKLKEVHWFLLLLHNYECLIPLLRCGLLTGCEKWSILNRQAASGYLSFGPWPSPDARPI